MQKTKKKAEKPELQVFRDTIPYGKNQERSCDLQCWGPIRKFECNLVVDVSAASHPEPKEDALFRLIDTARIKAVNAKTFFDILDGRSWKFLTDNPNDEELPSRGEQKVIKVPLNIEFLGTNIGIPVENLVNLIFEVVWTDRHVLGNHKPCHFIVNDAYLEIKALYQDSLSVEKWKLKGMRKPRYTPANYYLNGDRFTNECRIGLPVGQTILRTWIIGIDESNNRVADPIEQILVTQRGVEVDKFNPMQPVTEPPKNINEGIIARPKYIDKGVELIEWLKDGRPGLDLENALPNEIEMTILTTFKGKLEVMHYGYWL